MKQLVLFLSLFVCVSSYAQIIKKRVYVEERRQVMSTETEEGRIKIRDFLSRTDNASIEDFEAFNQIIDSGRAQEIIREAQENLRSYLEGKEFVKDNYGIQKMIKRLDELTVALSIECGLYGCFTYIKSPEVSLGALVSYNGTMEDALLTIMKDYSDRVKREIDKEDERLRKLSIINLDDFTSLEDDFSPHINDEGRELIKDIQDKDQMIKNTPRALEA